MKTIKKIGIGFGLFLLLGFAFLVWYKMTYSMRVVTDFEINKQYTDQKVLIATQGSDYKDAVTDGLVAYLQPKKVYVKVIDVTELGNVDPDKWDALVIIHTFEQWHPQPDAEKFLKANYDPDKMFVICTSGSGDKKVEGVDAITGPSITEDVAGHIKVLSDKLDGVLNKR